MSNIDKNDQLRNSPFTFKVTKEKKIIISYNGRVVVKLGEKESLKLLRKIEGKSEFDIQLDLAKVTGNFKRGNEK